MSRRDYEGIALTVCEARISRKDRKTVAFALADYFERSYERFNRQKFLLACEVWG
jgi:hypothetical protein